jgi:hypothetical protein
MVDWARWRVHTGRGPFAAAVGLTVEAWRWEADPGYHRESPTDRAGGCPGEFGPLLAGRLGRLLSAPGLNAGPSMRCRGCSKDAWRLAASVEGQ